jgi:two-component system, LytTR family, sensor kinase
VLAPEPRGGDRLFLDSQALTGNWIVEHRASQPDSQGIPPEPDGLHHGDLMFLRSSMERGTAFNPPAPEVGTGNWKHWLRFSGLFALAWLAMGFLQANVIYILRVAAGVHTSPMIYHLPWALLGSAAWALATPLIVYFARRFPITGAHPVRNGLIHLGLALVTHVVLTYLLLFVREATYPKNPLYAKLIEGVLWDLTMYAIVVALAHASWLSRDSRLRREQALRLEAKLARSRFEALTLQLQPHFLFNSLNAISELVYRDPKLADHAITRLAELLRMALANSGQIEGTLEEEMRFLDAYAEIERLRSGGGLQLEWDIPEEARQIAVPVLILQPLVENAFRHGLRAGGGSRVDVAARLEGGTLHVAVTDDGRGLGGDVVREGLGLRNTRERLESLYGSLGRIELSEGAGRGVRVEIALPARSLREGSREILSEIVTARYPENRSRMAEEAAG